MTWTIFILGAVFAGFVQGLTGFAFALIAMSFWTWVLSPQLAAPLVVFASLWSHIISISQEKKQISHRSLLIPYLCAGLIGVPLGTFLLSIVEANTFKTILGIFLLLWCPMMLFQPQWSWLIKSGSKADACIGFIGGVLGGLGGFCGAIPSAWVMLKNLPKDQQRYILRHFNFAVQVITFSTYLLQQTISTQHIPYMLVLLVSVSLPAFLGARFFYQISEQNFKRIVLSLLFFSGLTLVISQLI